MKLFAREPLSYSLLLLTVLLKKSKDIGEIDSKKGKIRENRQRRKRLKQLAKNAAKRVKMDSMARLSTGQFSKF